MVAEIRATAGGAPRILATCRMASAAVNRNAALRAAQTLAVIMLDDDVGGFAPDWNLQLEAALDAPDAVMVSARLMHKNGAPGQMLGNPPYDAGSTETVEVPRRELPTACIVFRNIGMSFRETYVGSGWEDTDFCAQLRGVYPSGRFLVHNGVRVTHYNEMKNQGPHFVANQARYVEVWGPHPYHAP